MWEVPGSKTYTLAFDAIFLHMSISLRSNPTRSGRRSMLKAKKSETIGRVSRVNTVSMT